MEGGDDLMASWGWNDAMTFLDLFKLAFNTYIFLFGFWFFSAKQWSRGLPLVPIVIMFEIFLTLWIKTW